MRLVSETSAAEIGRLRAERELEAALKTMASNLLRIIRGAGRPQQLLLDLSACLDAAQAHFEAIGAYPSGDLIAKFVALEQVGLLAFSDHEDVADPPDEISWLFAERELRERDLTRAALQIVASTFVGQRTQRSRGQDDLLRAIKAHEEVKERLEAYWQSKNAPAAKKIKRPQRKPLR